MMNKFQKNRGFSIPEVIVAISLVVLIILTATNLLVSSMRANRNNVNRIIAYNLAQEAIEGFRNVRDGNWLQNQYWRGADYSFFGDFFDEDGKYIINKKHVLFTEGQCSQGSEVINSEPTVSFASPWEVSIYNEEASKMYYGGSGYTEYTHNAGGEFSGFKRWVEIKDVDVNGNKIALIAVVEWEERSKVESIRIPTILTDWKK